MVKMSDLSLKTVYVDELEAQNLNPSFSGEEIDNSEVESIMNVEWMNSDYLNAHIFLATTIRNQTV